MESLEHLRPWMEWIAAEPLELAARRQLMERWRREWKRGGDVMLAIFVDGALAGGSGLHRRIGPHQPGITHAEIHTDRANLRSAAVARRAGYTLVGETPRARRAPAESGIELVWRLQAPGDPEFAGEP